MKYEVRYKPAFAAIFITLEPGESIIAEAGAMASMDGDVTMTTQLAGGILNAVIRAWLGGESPFVNTFTNKTDSPQQVVFTQGVIGDIEGIELKQGGAMCFQPGAYIASTPRVRLTVRWAGFNSWIAGEGLFKLQLEGRGMVFFGAYGGLTKKQVTNDFVVDNSHLVAYEPQLKMNIRFAKGIIGSLTSGEGLVNHIKGSGTIYMQSRSIDGLVSFVRKRIRI
ncbi:MAG: TIGR00266 family protein [Spirulina sp. SIO3F2]|nr:TIGR00266 family protein [Spirulina sp. SIO3F2]